jgi:hypothetical protein
MDGIAVSFQASGVSDGRLDIGGWHTAVCSQYNDKRSRQNDHS